MEKEDYFVLATLVLEHAEISNVPCKIYLPEHVNDKPRMKFRPNREQYKIISLSHEGALKAEVKDFYGKPQVLIESPAVYFENIITTYWGPDICESTFDGEPQDLIITEYLSSPPEFQKTSLVLWLSPNKMLSPPIIETVSYNGRVEIEKGNQLEFQLQKNGINITFDKHYSYGRTDDKELRQWSFLVASADVEIPAQDVYTFKCQLLPELDDFLLVASLGSRTLTGCLGWQATDNICITTYYRGKFTFPTGATEFSFDQGLVWLKDFKKFLTQCYNAFVSHPNKNALRGAIRSLVPGRTQVFEESFLALFSGLERLILDYRRRENLEFALPMHRWSKLKKKLRDSVKASDDPKLSREERSFIYSKIDELNRVPLRAAFDRFCTNHGVDLSDLWPVFASRREVSLSDIRNWLIHGESFPKECQDALCIAHDNLRWTIERMVIKILGWSVEITEVKPGFLKKHAYSLKTMPAEQSRISQIIYG